MGVTGLVLLDRLKAKMAPPNQRMERDLALAEGMLSLDRYQRLLARFYGFHAAFFRPRHKVALLIRDLDSVGYDSAAIHALPVCPQLPQMGSRAQALGSICVLDGATLGGQIIGCHIERMLRLANGAGHAFSDSYRHEFGPMWKAFRAWPLAWSSLVTDDLIALSACQTFDRLHRRLCRNT